MTAVSIADFQAVEGIYFPKTVKPQYADSKALWEDAAVGWTKTGYGAHKPGGIWARFPANQHFNTIADLGCGYGRHGAYLALDRGITCDRYFATDISEGMLRRLLKVKGEADFFAEAEFQIVCMPLKELPLADNSVDLLYSSSVFMHLQEEDIKLVLAEIYRVLKPGGGFIFNDSFHNKNCPSYKLSNLFRVFTPAHKTMYLRQYSLAEIETLLQECNIAEKSGNYKIVPSQYQVLPPKFKQLLPGGAMLNRRLIETASPETKQTTYASGYSAYSTNLHLDP
jgi:ubiquinone/menaquinone biosynthesis C-methylase UbiE